MIGDSSGAKYDTGGYRGGEDKIHATDFFTIDIIERCECYANDIDDYQGCSKKIEGGDESNEENGEDEEEGMFF